MYLRSAAGSNPVCGKHADHGICQNRAEPRTVERRQSAGSDIFYPMYVAAENVIGDVEGVTLENLSEPQTGCLHDYQLTAVDMKLLSKADVFIVNGGGIESFLSDVAESYPNLKIIQACDGIELLQAAEGTEDVDSDEAESEEHLHETETADTKAESDVHDEEADHADHDHSEHSHGG